MSVVCISTRTEMGVLKVIKHHFTRAHAILPRGSMTQDDRKLFSDLQFLDFPGKGIAAHPQQAGRFNASPSRVLEGFCDEDSLELLGQGLQDGGISPVQHRAHLVLKGFRPVDARSSKRFLILSQFWGQVCDIDILAWCHDRQPVADVLQLPHVASPVQG